MPAYAPICTKARVVTVGLVVGVKEGEPTPVQQMLAEARRRRNQDSGKAVMTKSIGSMWTRLGISTARLGRVKSKRKGRLREKSHQDPQKRLSREKANLRWLAWQCIEFSPVETTRHQRVKREKAQTSKFRGLYRPPGACCVLDLLPTNSSCNVTAPIARLPCVCCRCQRIAHPSPFFSASLFIARITTI